MLSVPSPRPESQSAETKRQPGLTKSLCAAAGAAAKHTCGEEAPAAQHEKTYQPTVFTGVNQNNLNDLRRIIIGYKQTPHGKIENERWFA